MDKAPVICPACGELIIVLRYDEHTLAVPTHPDRVMPSATCVARVSATYDWSLILP
jgi:hypothetical protein